ncbi:UNVERIFIED_CONTAM: hypothetical protein K2H54_053394 [Gekko kuhli]
MRGRSPGSRGAAGNGFHGGGWADGPAPPRTAGAAVQGLRGSGSTCNAIRRCPVGCRHDSHVQCRFSGSGGTVAMASMGACWMGQRHPVLLALLSRAAAPLVPPAMLSAVVPANGAVAQGRSPSSRGATGNGFCVGARQMGRRHCPGPLRLRFHCNAIRHCPVRVGAVPPAARNGAVALLMPPLPRAPGGSTSHPPASSKWCHRDPPNPIIIVLDYCPGP